MSSSARDTPHDVRDCEHGIRLYRHCQLCLECLPAKSKEQSATYGGSSNLIAEFTDWTGEQVQVHGLRDGFAVFVGDRLVQKSMNGTDMARYFCHVLHAKNALIKSISAPSEIEPKWPNPDDWNFVCPKCGASPDGPCGWPTSCPQERSRDGSGTPTVASPAVAAALCTECALIGPTACSEHGTTLSATPCSLRDAFELRGTYAESLGDKREVVDDAESIAGGLRQMLLARGWYEGNPEGALGEIEHRIRVLLGEKS